MASGTSLHYGLGTKIEIYNFVLYYITDHQPQESCPKSSASFLLGPHHHNFWAPADRTHHTQALGEQTKLEILKKYMTRGELWTPLPWQIYVTRMASSGVSDSWISVGAMI